MLTSTISVGSPVWLRISNPHPKSHYTLQIFLYIRFRVVLVYFGMRIATGPEPTNHLEHGQILTLGDRAFEVRHCPGHTPGHVVFYCAAEKVLFSGDVIFWGSIGRTDLPGGDYDALIHSIYSQILTLPNETRLLSGHGGETTVGFERRENPFLS